ncbi:MAG TPA: DUF4258 domain-containing protein [Candidatus Nanoarchaeia archaeon]|nr:DUF4258 domain-containing protein [Candidatus Nanoarchaeia archaeon]
MNVVFTEHAKEKLSRRKILEEEVYDAIRYPNHIIKKYGKYYFQKRLDRGIIELVCEMTERDLKVITLYWM